MKSGDVLDRCDSQPKIRICQILQKENLGFFFDAVMHNVFTEDIYSVFHKGRVRVKEYHVFFIGNLKNQFNAAPPIGKKFWMVNLFARPTLDSYHTLITDSPSPKAGL